MLLFTPFVSFPLMDYEYQWFGAESLTFRVTDATTGKAVSGAQVAVLAEGTWEPEIAERYGHTDADGLAQAFGPFSGVGVHSYATRNQQSIRFRGERVEVEAPGYEHHEILLRDLVRRETIDLPQTPIEIQLTPGKSAAELAPLDDLAALQGKWYLSRANEQSVLHRDEIEFKEQDLCYRLPSITYMARFSIDSTVKPKVMRFERVEGYDELPAIAIYRVNGHRMEICFARRGQVTPPADFSNSAGRYIRLRRASTTIEKPLPVGSTSRFTD